MRDCCAYEISTGRDPAEPDARERLALRGTRALSDLDLIMILLGTGMRGKPVTALAVDVLDLLDGDRESFEGLFKGILGIGKVKTGRILSALELGRRLYGPRGKRIGSPQDLFPLVRHWADRKHECFICASLNGAHEVIDIRLISRGLVNRTMAHPREVFADAVTDRACAVAVAHNHPSGKLDPSPDDLDLTKRLRRAGSILGIPLIDHIVFSDSGFYSFVEHGLIDPGAHVD